METMAPRVANLQVDMSHAVAQQVQQLVPTMQVHVILVCRGTERYQLPLQLSERHVNIMRHTVCMHRTTGEIHDLGCEDWYALKRQQRIRPAMPSKLMITSFGHPLQSEDHSRPAEARMFEPVVPRVARVNAGAPCPDKNPRG